MFKKYFKLFLVFLIVLSIYPIYSLMQVNVAEYATITKLLHADKFEISGSIASNSSVMLALSYPVYIKESFVSENSYVNKGQLLFTLDKERMTNTLKDNNAISAQGATEVYASLSSDTLYGIEENIYASESGMITEINAENGGFVMQGISLCSISQTEDCIIKIAINQEDYSRILIGDNLVVSPLIANELNYTAKITSKTAAIRKEITPLGAKTVIDVYARILDPDDYIIPGLELTGYVTSNSSKEINTLPYECIFQDDGGEFVNIFEAGKVQKVYIKTGIELENAVEILSVFSANTVFLKTENIKKDKILLKNEI